VNIAANGKSIGEVREKWNRQVQFRPNVADIFSMKLNYKKYVEWKNSGGEKVVDFQFRV